MKKFKINPKMDYILNDEAFSEMQNVDSEVDIQDMGYVILREKDVVNSLNYSAGTIWLNMKEPISTDDLTDKILTMFSGEEDESKRKFQYT